MSSSRIIKFLPGGTAESMPSFTFRPIGQAAPDSQGVGGFVPMGLFDTSELSGYVKEIKEEISNTKKIYTCYLVDAI